MVELFFVSAPECRDTVLGSRTYVRPQKHAQTPRGWHHYLNGRGRLQQQKQKKRKTTA